MAFTQRCINENDTIEKNINFAPADTFSFIEKNLLIQKYNKTRYFNDKIIDWLGI